MIATRHILGLAATVVAIAACSPAPAPREINPTNEPQGVNGPGPAAPEPNVADLAAHQVAAKAGMKAALREPGSAKYQDVQAYPLGDGYVFCGKVNAKNGFGGFTGFERFVVAGSVVATESQVADFPTLWAKACVGSGQPVWF